MWTEYRIPLHMLTSCDLLVKYFCTLIFIAPRSRCSIHHRVACRSQEKNDMYIGKKQNKKVVSQGRFSTQHSEDPEGKKFCFPATPPPPRPSDSSG